MDYGIHPPTIYFPLVVPEALMIEPTETEPKERLDAFIEVMKTIAREAAETPELAQVRAADAPGAAARRGEGGQGADRTARIRAQGAGGDSLRPPARTRPGVLLSSRVATRGRPGAGPTLQRPQQEAAE